MARHMFSRALVIVVTLGSGLGVLILGVKDVRAARGSLAWPSAPGVIEHVDPEASENCIRFSYSVAGQTYTASTVFFEEDRVTTNGERPSCRDSVVRRYSARQTIAVHYDPANPGRAVLEPGPYLGSYIPLALGAMLVLGGGAFLWHESGRIRRRLQRRHDRDRRPARAAGPLESSLITPSEVVAIHGAYFAPSTPGDNVRLLDGTKAGARELVIAELSAAILALEQVGAIQLELMAAPQSALQAVPTATAFAWPSPSTESRLQDSINHREEVGAIVRRWLAYPSQLGWRRAAEKVHLGLVLRRLATVQQSGSRRRYLPVDGRASYAATGNLAAVTDLLRRCESDRPALWHELSVAITAAVEKHEQPPKSLLDAYAAVDPWYDEAAADVSAVPGLALYGDVTSTRREVFIGGIILWTIVAAAVYLLPASGRQALTAGVLASAVLFGAAVASRRRWIGAASRRWPRLRLPLEHGFGQGWWQSAVTLVPLGGLLMALAFAIVRESAAGLAALVAGIAMIVMWLGRNRARTAITRQVVGAPRSPQPVTVDASEITIHAPVVASPLPVRTASPVTMTIVRPADLPQVSAPARERLTAIRARGPSVRRLYRMHVATLAAASVAIALIAWWLLEGLSGAAFPWFTIVLAALTLAAVARARITSESTLVAAFLVTRHALRYLRGGAAQERARWERQITPIRPVVEPLLHLFWTGFTVLRALTYLGASTTARWIPILFSAVLVVASGWWLRRDKSALESRYPVYPPLRLLALRVFGSPTPFVDLLDLWHWFGPLYRLDGPDTAGGKVSDVLAYATGRLHAAITENATELDEALQSFSHTRDAQLRFRINSLQCNDRVWKDALHRLLDLADVVVMDLSGYTHRNRGCAYEIGRLVGLGLDRVLLLVDDDTDLAALRELFGEVAATRPAGAGDLELRLLNLGAQTGRRDQESVYEWQRRAADPIDADRLVGVLFDAASHREPAPHPIDIRWTRPNYRRGPRSRGR